MWFAINNGSNDILSKALDQIHLIEIQMIHKNLELWIPADSLSDDFNDADSEEEFIDALTTVRNILYYIFKRKWNYTNLLSIYSLK